MKLIQFTLILPLILLMPHQAEPEFSIYWDFNDCEYAPGDSGVVTMSIENTGSIPFYVTWIGIHFQWEREGYFFQIDYSSSPVYLDVGEKKSLGAIQFEVFDTAVPGENSYYLEIDYAWYSDGEFIEDSWNTETFRLTVVEPLTVSWEIQEETSTFTMGESLHYLLTVKNNMNTDVKIVSYGIRADWLPKDMYEFVNVNKVVPPGSEEKFGPTEFKISRTAEEKWYNCSVIIEYQYMKNGGWTQIKIYKPTMQYGIEVVREESFISRFKEILGFVGAALSVIATIITLKEKLKRK